MSFRIHDVLNVGVVILGADLVFEPDAVEALKAAIGTDIRVATAQPPGDLESTTLVLDRERVEVTTRGSRSTILRWYPEEKDLPKSAEVAALVLAVSGQDVEPIEAVGYNLEIVFEQFSGHPASRYIGERLFDYQSLGDETWPLMGGVGRITFGDPHVNRTFTVEARFGDEQTTRVFVSANLHVAGNRIPTVDQIKQSLDTIWRDTFNLMEQLDQKGAA